jgi:hypothetical protein
MLKLLTAASAIALAAGPALAQQAASFAGSNAVAVVGGRGSSGPVGNTPDFFAPAIAVSGNDCAPEARSGGLVFPYGGAGGGSTHVDPSMRRNPCQMRQNIYMLSNMVVAYRRLGWDQYARFLGKLSVSAICADPQLGPLADQSFCHPSQPAQVWHWNGTSYQLGDTQEFGNWTYVGAQWKWVTSADPK